MGPPVGVHFSRKIVSVELHKADKERLRREECYRVKHDKLFSDWKILVGPSDWESHASNEEGSQRYHLQSLPRTYFGPGVYELGLTLQNLSAPRAARPRKIRKQDVIVVYLGQAENVRHRLQTYGQSGSHLEGARVVPRLGVEDCEYDDQRNSPSVQNGRTKADGSSDGGSERGLNLFTGVFSRGYSIVFRWAKTESKQMAEKVESELLQVFDYPWNRGLNGVRRPDDILARLELMQCQLEESLCLGRFLTVKSDLFQRNVGIRVPVKKPTEERYRGASRFSVFRARSKDGLPEDGSKSGAPLCGVLLNDGSRCSMAPVKGRRRCTEHKGLRAQLTTRRPRLMKSKTAESGGKVNTLSNGDNFSGDRPVLVVKSTPHGKRLEFGGATSHGMVCGVISDSGSVCSNVPVNGRRRCAAHKGMHLSAKSTGSPKSNEKPSLRGIPTPDRKTFQRQ